MDPLTRGSLFHAVQTAWYRDLQSAGAVPVTAASVDAAVRKLDEGLERVAADYEELLVPAIERVWQDEVRDLRRDLVIWVQRMADDPKWHPSYFEYSFGLDDEGRDPMSVPDPVLVDGRFLLRGSVDLVERIPAQQLLRITDHKTGKNRSTPGLVVGGGEVLQPVLYGMAIERSLGARVLSGRLYYCTTTGGFASHEIALTDAVRRQALEVLEIVDRAIERGFLVAAPGERACTWCNFRPVCGPREEDRVADKHQQPIADLIALRGMA
jgi:hypothetical protein